MSDAARPQAAAWPSGCGLIWSGVRRRRMAGAPDVLIRTPNGNASPMDALSDVLRIIRLKGGVFLHAEFTAPWCVFAQIAREDCGSLLADAEHLVLYHYV